MSAQFIPIVLPNEPIGGGIGGPSVPLLGHGGFILVDSTGKATFYEFGHWKPIVKDSNGNIIDPGDIGVVTTNTSDGGNNGAPTNMRQWDITGTMQFDSSGNITPSSLQFALDQVFGTSGLYTGDPGMVFSTPIAIDDNRYGLINTALVKFKDDVNAGKNNYDLFGINCIKFVYDMADAGLITISSTQNFIRPDVEGKITIPSIAANSILDYIGTGYQYFSPLSWLSNSHSIMEKISSFANVMNINDLGVQLLKTGGENALLVAKIINARLEQFGHLVTQAGLTIMEVSHNIAVATGKAVGEIVAEFQDLMGTVMSTISGLSDSISTAYWKFLDSIAKSLIDPLIIDLSNNGIALDSWQVSNALFDLNGNGTKENTGWTKANGDDAFLVIDKNNDGKINDISEMFGNASIPGFTELAKYDSNKDNLINSLDSQFSLLKLWNDKNANGTVDAGEMTTIAANDNTPLFAFSKVA